MDPVVFGVIFAIGVAVALFAFKPRKKGGGAPKPEAPKDNSEIGQ